MSATIDASRELDVRVAMERVGWGWVGRQDVKWLAPLTTIDTDDPDEYGPTRLARDTDKAESPWWLDDTSKTMEVDVVPHFSTDISAAFSLVEHMAQLEPQPWVLTLRGWNHDGAVTYTAQFTQHAIGAAGDEMRADTPQHAICLAALAIKEAA